jgi:hypothetical protein
MKKSLIIPILLFLCFCIARVLSANAPNKIIQYAEGTKIYEVDRTARFLCVVTSHQSSQQFTAYLYNKNGEMEFEYVSNEKCIVKAAVIDELDYFLVVLRGSSAPLEDSHAPERIKVFDISSKELIWETECSSFFYELSPDSKWLLTIKPIGLAGIQLINTKDGAKKNINISCSYVHFLDNKNVVTASQTFTKYKTETDLKVDTLEFEIEEIRHDEVALMHKYKYKKIEISEAEYNIRKQNLSAKEDSIDNIIRILTTGTVTDSSGNIIDRYRRSNDFGLLANSVEMKIYNIVADTLTNEMPLFDQKGNKIFIDNDWGIEPIHTDGQGSIYFDAQVESAEGRIPSLFKFDRNLKLVWQKQLGGSYRIRKLYHEGESNFYVSYANNSIYTHYIIDDNTGGNIEQADFIGQYDYMQLSDFDQTLYAERINIYKDIKIDLKGARITLIR